ncbi:MAG: hypothetical protein ACYSR9_11545 [Planctomycetota bacterium]|jgi:hypothetical protein
MQFPFGWEAACFAEKVPGKLEVIEPEEPQDRYGEIWPKDSVIHDEGEI